MSRVAVLIPVLSRPENVTPLVRSIRESSTARPTFICSPADTDEIDAVLAAGEAPLVVTWRAGQGDWARKINLGFTTAVELDFEWALLGADDLRFHPGWVEAAVAVHEATGACVVGTNDMGNPEVMAGRHSTHPLVHRDYLECGTIDESGKIVHEGYYHNWVDTELVGTAKHRDTWAFAADSRVEHLHPFWHKGEDDEIYEIGREHYAEDRRLYQARQRLWS